jgi:hypothetical protein
MATRKELEARAQSVPNQKGSRVDQIGALSTYEVDITKVAPSVPFSVAGNSPVPGQDPTNALFPVSG